MESSSSSCSNLWNIPGLGRPQITEFLAWALFTQERADLSIAEHEELDRCLAILQSRVGLVFPEEEEESSPPPYQYKARRLCLENLSPLHRPMLVYICVEVVRALAGLVLRCNGFRPTHSHAGAVATTAATIRKKKTGHHCFHWSFFMVLRPQVWRFIYP